MFCIKIILYNIPRIIKQTQQSLKSHIFELPKTSEENDQFPEKHR
jgi:hypothetical protein